MKNQVLTKHQANWPKMLKTLPPLPENDPLLSKLAALIKKAIREFYDDILKQDQEIMNSNDYLELALIRGKIIFKDGKFTGSFDRYTSKALKDLGAVFKKGAWELSSDKIPSKYLSAIMQGMALNNRQFERVLDNLVKFHTDRIATRKDIKAMSERLFENLDKSINEKAKRVPTVNLQIDETQKQAIKDSYSENLKLHIKGWADDEILKLREKVQENYKSGVRYEDLAKDIMKRRDGISVSKALFIARQETRLMSASVQQQKYTKAGLNEYVWKIRKDDRVRHDHEILDGKIFRWDDPPVIDERTGRRGNPGQDYNCRCYALSLIK